MRLKTFAVIVALAACESPTAPLHPSGLPADAAAAIVGTWTLTHWNSKPVPAIYATWLGPCSVDDCALGPDSVARIAGGTIALNDNATYARTTHWRIDRPDGTTQRTFETVEHGNYTGSVASGAVVLHLFAGVRMQIGITGNSMSARYVVDDPFFGPIIQGDVWTHQKN